MYQSKAYIIALVVCAAVLLVTDAGDTKLKVLHGDGHIDQYVIDFVT
jgi:hypothetical protein